MKNWCQEVSEKNYRKFLIFYITLTTSKQDLQIMDTAFKLYIVNEEKFIK